MARVRDLWHDKSRRKTARHPDRTKGRKDTKRWLAIWSDPDGNEKTKAFSVKDVAAKYAARMEADAVRGEYIAPDAGKELFGAVARKYLRLLKVGMSTRRRYDSVYRNHVEPEFGKRRVAGIRPSDVKGWLRDLDEQGLSRPMQEAALLLVRGTFDFAVDDGLCRGNPAKGRNVRLPKAENRKREGWDAATVWQVIDGHPEYYRPLPVAAAALGLRQGEAYGLAEEDIDFAAGLVHIRRQIHRDGMFAFKLPKGGKERTVPLPRGAAQVLRAHIAANPPQPYALPWMAERGRTSAGEHVCRLLFRWRERHIVAASYDQGVWKPALSRAGLIPPPVKDARGINRYKGNRRDTMHLLRHFYSTTLQDAGVSLAGVMEFLGHSDAAAPLAVGVYGHVTEQTLEDARNAVDRTLFRLRPVSSGTPSSGTVAELRRAR